MCVFLLSILTGIISGVISGVYVGLGMARLSSVLNCHHRLCSGIDALCVSITTQAGDEKVSEELHRFNAFVYETQRQLERLGQDDAAKIVNQPADFFYHLRKKFQSQEVSITQATFAILLYQDNIKELPISYWPLFPLVGKIKQKMGR